MVITCNKQSVAYLGRGHRGTSPGPRGVYPTGGSHQFCDKI